MFSIFYSSNTHDTLKKVVFVKHSENVLILLHNLLVIQKTATKFNFAYPSSNILTCDISILKEIIQEMQLYNIIDTLKFKGVLYLPY